MEELLSLVNGSLSFAMLIGAIVLSATYPNFAPMPSFARSMICWFIVLGPVRWLNIRLSDVKKVHGSDGFDIFRAWLILALYLIIGGVGFYYLVHAVSFLP